MLVVRNVFRAKYGMGDALVEHFVGAQEMLAGPQNVRVLTDASGPFFTVVVEGSYESFVEYERNAVFARPEFSEWFAKMVPLVESGEREFWTVQYTS